MIRLSLLFLLIGAGFMAFGYSEYRLSRKVKDQPQSMTLAQLASNGPGDNANILLTNFRWGGAYIYQEDKKSRTNEWTKVWIPIVADDAATDATFNVIFMSTHAGSEADLHGLEKTSPLPGVVINEVDSLGEKEKTLLRESYPQVNLDKCWIFEHRRETTGIAKSLVSFIGGLCFFLIGGGTLLTMGKKSE